MQPGNAADGWTLIRESSGIKAIMSSGGSYASVEKATTDIFATYFERYITDEKLVDRIKNDKNMIAEITDMISTECGATNVTLEGIVAQYVEKYSK